MSTTIPTQIEKCIGAMLATAIGDALGWPNEPRSKNRVKNLKVSDQFIEWTRICSNPRYHDERILPGEYSDDTQMTLSVARSIIAGDWEHFLAEKELPFWLKYERGGGGAILKAAKSISEKKILLWQSNYTRDYFNAGGNGAAMRILPHVIAAAKKPDIQTLMLDVIKDTLITHGHPRAFLGATCYAYALDYLLRKETVLEYGELVSAVIDGQKAWGMSFLNLEIFGRWLETANLYCGFDFVREWDAIFSNMVRQFDFIKTSLKKGLMIDDYAVLTQLECFSKANGAGDVAALASIYLASRYANNPTLGIKIPAFSFGVDTDTIASITGGLLGMLSGTNWIPTEWKIVQDYDCLVQIAEVLYSDNKKEAAKVKTTEIKSKNNGWKISPIGAIRQIDSRQVPNGQNGFVVITKWLTVLGQTIYTKEFDDRRQTRQPNGQMQLDMQPTDNNSMPVQPTIQQTTVPKTGQSKPAQQAVEQKQFRLTNTIINALLAKSEFKQTKTVGKIFKVIQALIEDQNSPEVISKQFNVDLAMVELLQGLIDNWENEVVEFKHTSND